MREFLRRTFVVRRQKSLVSQFEVWCQGFAALGDSIISVCTFGLVWSSFEMNLVYWHVLRKYDREAAESDRRAKD